MRDGGNMDQRRGSGVGEKAGFREVWKDLGLFDMQVQPYVIMGLLI